MKMQLNQLIEKLSAYSSTVLVGKAKSWMAKFAIGAGAEAVIGKAESFIRATGTMSEDGTVDIDSLRCIVAAGFKSAGHLDLFGGLLGFDPQDAEDFFQYLER